jgi:hypothetical protein
MPNYNVVMGQGVTVAALTGNMLLTGSGGAEDAIQTCSAIILFNTNTRAAGLFHFPEGSINNDVASRTAVTAMVTAVHPNVGYIGIGVQNLRNADVPGENQREQLQHGEQLRSYVLGLLPLGCPLRRFAASSGHATVTCGAGGPAVIGSVLPGAITDLRADAAGNHGGYVTYGAAI